jgi:hypothetical protein
MSKELQPEKKPYSTTAAQAGLLQGSRVHEQQPEAVPPIVHEVLQLPGQPLDSETRRIMESHFGHAFNRITVYPSGKEPIHPKLTITQPDKTHEREADAMAGKIESNFVKMANYQESTQDANLPRFDFSKVRVHTDAKAANSVKSVKALAYTVGHNVVFGSGLYEPTTLEGRKLLAHELAHVVQQGQATPTLTLPGINNNTKRVVAERIQRKDDPDAISIRGSYVKAQIKLRDPTLFALIENNLFDKQYEEARRERINNEEHVWTLAIEWQFAGFETGGETAEFPDMKKNVKGKTTVIHPIYIRINPYRFDDPDLKTKIPNVKNRLEYMASETLYHELIHVQILIDDKLPKDMAKSVCYSEYQNMITIAKSPGLELQRSKVVVQLIRLMDIVNALKNDLAVRYEFEESCIDFLINEKYVNEKAVSGFVNEKKSMDKADTGFIRQNSNLTVAKSYAGIVAGKIRAKGQRPKSESSWNETLARLELSVNNLYDGIDEESIRLHQGTLPRSELAGSVTEEPKKQETSQ